MKHTILAVSLAAILAACGGGSDAPASTVSAPDRAQASRVEAPQVDNQQESAPRLEDPRGDAPSNEDEPKRSKEEAATTNQEPTTLANSWHIHTTPDPKLESSWFADRDMPTASKISKAYFTVGEWLASDRKTPNDAEEDAVEVLLYWTMVRDAFAEVATRNTYASCAILKAIEEKTLSTLFDMPPRDYAHLLRRSVESTRELISNPQNYEDEVYSNVNFAASCVKR